MNALADLLARDLHPWLSHPPPLPAPALSRVAHALLFDHVLHVLGTSHSWRLTEFEFYIHDPANHPDPFCHCDPSMVASAQWYVHKSGGTRKGMDVTCGFQGVHGGILIRGLDSVRGPSKCVDLVLAALGVATAKELDARKDALALVPRDQVTVLLGGTDEAVSDAGATSATTRTLAPIPRHLRQPVHVSPRVGLVPKAAPRAGRGHRPAMPEIHTQLTYVFAPYRYQIDPCRSPHKYMAAMGQFEGRAGDMMSARDWKMDLLASAAAVTAWDEERKEGESGQDVKALVHKVGKGNNARAWMRLRGWYGANRDRWEAGQVESDLSDADA